ncbi:Ulp1 protease family, C-terminal catalytic domain containing protein [Parasponia andersonii]|uniref:Ulp1 protease family, C-terminal catalytic domain containing protein n=1 Tax=Parasponia andersonii TaxID=3476 RepID=A0A2P5BBS1_PARAD|nr:Ulp1 protease family, C-terminal catalytic domain containing protein [Parasponia andersonii]
MLVVKKDIISEVGKMMVAKGSVEPMTLAEEPHCADVEGDEEKLEEIDTFTDTNPHKATEEKSSKASVEEAGDSGDGIGRKRKHPSKDGSTNCTLSTDLQGLKKFKISKGRIVGPFHLLHPLTEDFMVMQFIFTLSRPTCDVLIKYGKIDVDRDMMKCMKPGGEIFGRILVPILAKARANHWLLADINMMDQSVNLWDSLSTPEDRAKRHEAALEMLEIKMAFGEGFKFAKFAVNHVEGIPQQDNDKDCGIFMMKFMEHFSSKEEQMDQFKSDAAWLDLTLKLVQHDCNEVRDESPPDTRFSTKKQKSKNMILNSLARRTRQSHRLAMNNSALLRKKCTQCDNLKEELMSLESIRSNLRLLIDKAIEMYQAVLTQLWSSNVF